MKKNIAYSKDSSNITFYSYVLNKGETVNDLVKYIKENPNNFGSIDFMYPDFGIHISVKYEKGKLLEELPNSLLAEKIDLLKSDEEYTLVNYSVIFNKSNPLKMERDIKLQRYIDKNK